MNHSPVKLVVATTGFRGFAQQMRAMWGLLKEFAPYAAVELILPGGTVLAILCWLYRKRRSPVHPWRARNVSTEVI